jgi:hypothetical protein
VSIFWVLVDISSPLKLHAALIEIDNIVLLRIIYIWAVGEGLGYIVMYFSISLVLAYFLLPFILFNLLSYLLIFFDQV